MTESAYPYSALLLLFPGFNTLDVNGPLEVFRKSGTSKYFSVDIVAEGREAESSEGAHLITKIDFKDFTSKQGDKDLIDPKKLAKYDMLIVPGGPSSAVDAQAYKAKDNFFIQAIAAFADLAPESGKKRTLFSICTGAMFLGVAGIFNDGRYCTTHWACYDDLTQKITTAATDAEVPVPKNTVLPARYVDSGFNSRGVRIVNAGGISCGIDASFHVVRNMIGKGTDPNKDDGLEEARETAAMMDYPWRTTNGVVLEFNTTN